MFVFNGWTPPPPPPRTETNAGIWWYKSKNIEIMKDFKHTKGEWSFDSDEIGISIMSGNILIAKIFDESETLNGHSIYESIPNAKLIAAAPELLENLVRIMDRISENGFETYFPSAVRRANEAIKKATI